ncbi:MAG: hypothetical protein ACLR6O_00615 [Eubacterium sp.]
MIEAYKNLETDKKLVIAGGASHAGDYFARSRNETAEMILSLPILFKVMLELYSNAIFTFCRATLRWPLSLLEAIAIQIVALLPTLRNVPKFARKMQFISKKR